VPRRRLTSVISSLAATLAGAACLTACASGASGASAGAPAATSQRAGTQYYLALGDSLAAGYQPDGTTGQGYPNQLDAQLPAAGEDVTLENLGCGGETTETMVRGGICSYQGTSGQLGAAVAFLHAHQGQVPLITIDIGINDVYRCTGLATASGADSCFAAVVPTLSKNLTGVLRELRAVDPSAVIAGLNYYAPELARWLDGASGQALAAAQLSATKVMNAALHSAYQAAGARSVDVFSAFKSADQSRVTTRAGYGKIPADVAAVCDWTWECTRGDEHANEAGYREIAKAVYAALPASITG
jgi:lysophospholipase L1-like esterase